MNQQAFPGGIAPPFLPISVSSTGVPNPPAPSVVGPMISYGQLPTAIAQSGSGSVPKEDHNHDQVWCNYRLLYLLSYFLFFRVTALIMRVELVIDPMAVWPLAISVH